MPDPAGRDGKAGRAAARLLAAALGALFLYSGVAKLRDPGAFEASVASFRLLPDAWVPLFAASLPCFEALAGLWLILGWRRRIPALALFCLNVVFLAALAQAWGRGLAISCGCFGSAPGPSMPLWADALRDAGLAGVSGWLAFAR